MNENKLNNIMNNIFDIIIQSVKIGIHWIENEVMKIKEAYFDEGSMNDEIEGSGIWNGGNTISKSSNDNGIEIQDITDTPYDVSRDSVSEVMYDGIMEEIEE